MSVLVNLSLSALAILMLAAFAVLYRLGIFSGTRAALAFIAICILGTAGFVGSLLRAAADASAGLASTSLVWAFGGAAAGLGGLVITFVSGAYFLHDMHPKNSTGKRTGWAAIIFATCLVSGVSGIAALNNIPGQVSNGVQNARTTFSNGG